ncbi:hypothetical protein HGA34_05255 [Candidatus Falkowbacteria bacterium]|nr:hypothetical protein [Candidatus Falkowbacteria bacterium]
MTFDDALNSLATLLNRPIAKSSDVLFWVIVVMAIYCSFIFLLLPALNCRPKRKAAVPCPESEIIVMGEHEHNYSAPHLIEYAPVGGGHHTNYSVMVCNGCMTAITFPQDNFLLTIPEHQEWLKSGLVDMGITLVLE